MQRHSHIPDKIKHWQEELLKDVENLPLVQGHRTGRIVVYGEEAAPILCGDEIDDVVIAAAEVGEKQGRVIVISHHDYADNFTSNRGDGHLTIFHENINHWLTKGAFANKDEILNLTKIADEDVDLERFKILMWDRVKCPSLNIDDKVNDFIENGGSFLYAVSPISWTKRTKKGLGDLPFMNILQKLGIVLTDKKSQYSCKSKGFLRNTPSNHHESLAKSHFTHLVQQCITETSKQIILENAKLFHKTIEIVPQSHLIKINDKLTELFEKCKVTIEQHAPNGQKKHKADHVIAHFIMCNTLSEMELGYKKLPGIDKFPGDVNEPDLKCTVIDIKADIKQAHPTGFWVPAGHTVEIKIVSLEHSDTQEENEQPESEESDKDDSNNEEEDNVPSWQVQIGCHSDKLHKKDSMIRWPKIFIKRKLEAHQNVFTPYGGLLYLISPNSPTHIQVQVTGVIEAPYFDLRQPSTVENWDEIRKAPGPWADICGYFFRVSIPSSSIRDLENPTEVMKLWDIVVQSDHQLRGTTAKRREWIVADVQPVVGALHSGYPIVSHMNIAEPNGILSLERLRTTGTWGIFHELGHNMQRSMWTFEGTREVTCNIFSLFATELVTQKPVLSIEWLEKRTDGIAKYLKEGADFKKWQKQNGVALALYGQLAHHFGWHSYRKVFSRYEIIPVGKRPKTTQQKVDAWFMKFSEAVEFNLVPIAEFWGIPLTKQTQLKLAPLKPFLPDDKYTALAPDRVENILSKFSDVTRAVDKTQLNVDQHWCPMV